MVVIAGCSQAGFGIQVGDILKKKAGAEPGDCSPRPFYLFTIVFTLIQYFTLPSVWSIAQVGSVVYDMVMESAGYVGPLRAWRAAEISVAAGNRFMCCRCQA